MEIGPAPLRDHHGAVEITALLHSQSRVATKIIVLQGSQKRHAFLIQINSSPLDMLHSSRNITVFAAFYSDYSTRPEKHVYPTAVAVFSAPLLGHAALLPDLSFSPGINHPWTTLPRSISSQIITYKEAIPGDDVLAKYAAQSIAVRRGMFMGNTHGNLTLVPAFLLGLLSVAAVIFCLRPYLVKDGGQPQLHELHNDTSPPRPVTSLQEAKSCLSNSSSSHGSSPPISVPGRLRTADGPVIRKLTYEDSLLELDADLFSQPASRTSPRPTSGGGKATAPRMQCFLGSCSGSDTPSKPVVSAVGLQAGHGVLPSARPAADSGPRQWWTRDAHGRLTKVGGYQGLSNGSTQSDTAGSGSGSTSGLSGSGSGDSPFVESSLRSEP